MNTAELLNLLHCALGSSQVRFLGVFAADRIPKAIAKYPACYILNTDPASEPGTHWVAVYHDSASAPVEFFDSYGDPPQKYGFELKRYVYNVHSLQSEVSDVCGHHCVYFLCQRSRGKSLTSIVNSLLLLCKHSVSLMDKYVKNYVIRLQRSCRAVPRSTCTTSDQCCKRRCDVMLK